MKSEKNHSVYIQQKGNIGFDCVTKKLIRNPKRQWIEILKRETREHAYGWENCRIDTKLPFDATISKFLENKSYFELEQNLDSKNFKMLRFKRESDAYYENQRIAGNLFGQVPEDLLYIQQMKEVADHYVEVELLRDSSSKSIQDYSGWQESSLYELSRNLDYILSYPNHFTNRDYSPLDESQLTCLEEDIYAVDRELDCRREIAEIDGSGLALKDAGFLLEL